MTFNAKKFVKSKLTLNVWVSQANCVRSIFAVKQKLQTSSFSKSPKMSKDV